jgi:AbrB family looped-hinge helix DNA binding protein
MIQEAVRVEKSGRILIPAEIRRRLNLVGGESEVILSLDDTGIVRLTTQQQTLQRIQTILNERLGPDRSLADELLADRRREAAQEDQR